MNIKDFCEKIYNGRMQMAPIWTSGQGAGTIRVAVSRELFEDLKRQAFKAFPGSIPVALRGNDFTVFGIPMIASRDLDGCEVRFRTEVTL